MNTPNHHEHSELWFRSSPTLPFGVLSTLIETEAITVTPRVGIRDGTHPKGYVPNTRVTLRLFDDVQQEQRTKQVCITKVVSKLLHDVSNWQSVQQDLSFFEGRPVAPDEIISLVEFSYLNHTQEESCT